MSGVLNLPILNVFKTVLRIYTGYTFNKKQKRVVGITFMYNNHIL